MQARMLVGTNAACGHALAAPPPPRTSHTSPLATPCSPAAPPATAACSSPGFACLPPAGRRRGLGQPSSAGQRMHGLGTKCGVRPCVAEPCAPAARHLAWRASLHPAALGHLQLPLPLVPAPPGPLHRQPALTGRTRLLPRPDAVLPPLGCAPAPEGQLLLNLPGGTSNGDPLPVCQGRQAGAGGARVARENQQRRLWHRGLAKPVGASVQGAAPAHTPALHSPAPARAQQRATMMHTREARPGCPAAFT